MTVDYKNKSIEKKYLENMPNNQYLKVKILKNSKIKNIRIEKKKLKER